MSEITNEQLIKTFFDFHGTITKVELMLNDLVEKNQNVALTLRNRAVVIIQQIIERKEKFSDIDYGDNYDTLIEGLKYDQEFNERLMVVINPEETQAFPHPNGRQDFPITVNYFIDSEVVENLFIMPLSYLTDERFVETHKIIRVSGGVK